MLGSKKPQSSGAAWILLLSLLIPSGAAVAQELPTFFAKNSKFAVPYQVNSNGNQIVEVQLFYSADGGRSWAMYSKRTPDRGQFVFDAGKEGEFWFGLKTIDRNQRVFPPGEVKPEIRIIVDYKKPQLNIDVQPDAAGRVVVSLKASDTNMDPSTLRILYHDSLDQSQPWKDSGVRFGRNTNSANFSPHTVHSSGTRVYQDQIAWWPKTQSTNIRVKVVIADRAGNTNEAVRQVVVDRRTVANRQNLRPQPTESQLPQNTFPTDVNRADPNDKYATGTRVDPYGGNIHVPSSPFQNASSVNNVFSNPPNESKFDRPKDSNSNPSGGQSWASSVQRSEQFQSVGSTNGQFDHRPQIAVPETNPATNHRNVETEFPNDNSDLVVSVGSTHPQLKNLGDSKAPANNSTESNQYSVGQDLNNRGLNSSNTSSGNAGQKVPARPVNARKISERKLARLMEIARPTNTKKFLLTYDVDAISPDQIEEVGLWMTIDGGNSWRKWAIDTDQVSPFAVEVDAEGIFGFRIVVSSKDGINSRIPKPGDTADMWVRVDESLPMVQILSAPFGRGVHAGKLVINWRAQDAQLTLRPITLMYSDRPEGPWTTIESGLRNSGQYVWKVGQGVPENVFLRIEARDTAGNQNLYQLAQPIALGDLVPRGRIKGLQPLRESPSVNSNHGK